MKKLFKTLENRYSILQLILRIIFILDILVLFICCALELTKIRLRLDFVTILALSILFFMLEDGIYNQKKLHFNEILDKYSMNSKCSKKLKKTKLKDSQFFNSLVITNMEIFGIILSVLYASYSGFHLQIYKLFNKGILLGVMIISFIFLVREIFYHYKLNAINFSTTIHNYQQSKRIENHNMKTMSAQEEKVMYKFVNKIWKGIIHLLKRHV